MDASVSTFDLIAFDLVAPPVDSATPPDLNAFDLVAAPVDAATPTDLNALDLDQSPEVDGAKPTDQTVPVDLIAEDLAGVIPTCLTQRTITVPCSGQSRLNRGDPKNCSDTTYVNSTQPATVKIDWDVMTGWMADCQMDLRLHAIFPLQHSATAFKGSGPEFLCGPTPVPATSVYPSIA